MPNTQNLSSFHQLLIRQPAHDAGTPPSLSQLCRPPIQDRRRGDAPTGARAILPNAESDVAIAERDTSNETTMR